MTSFCSCKSLRMILKLLWLTTDNFTRRGRTSSRESVNLLNYLHCLQRLSPVTSRCNEIQTAMHSGVWNSSFSISTRLFSIIVAELVVNILENWFPARKEKIKSSETGFSSKTSIFTLGNQIKYFLFIICYTTKKTYTYPVR